MFCQKCGSEIKENSNYCSACGEKINSDGIVEEKESSRKIKSDMLSTFSFWLMIITSPIILILRMICQETKVGFSWSTYTYSYLPDNLKVVLCILAIIMLGTSMVLKGKSNLHSKKFNVIMIIGYIISAIVSMIIIFW